MPETELGMTEHRILAGMIEQRKIRDALNEEQWIRMSKWGKKRAD
jgi:hypothetical protein